MRWRFDPLFSVKILHAKYQGEDWETKENPPAARDFILEPTPSTARRLKQLGWIFKSRRGACTVYGEKVFEADGTATLRAFPAPNERFTFFLRLDNPALLNETEPYAKRTPPNPQTPLPAFSGRTRTLYFDNRAPVAQPGGEFSLSPAEVDTDQLASAAPPVFTFTKPKTGVQHLKFTALAPGGGVFTVPLNQETKTANIELPESAYRLEQNPGGHAETIVLSADLPTGNVLGMIGIFEPAGGWEPLKRYRIHFKGAEE